jgi:hypothetical protein
MMTLKDSGAFFPGWTLSNDMVGTVQKRDS